jgi:hydrogenase 3 maturation protease
VIRGHVVQRALADWLSRPTLILGIGNRLRGDDAAGAMVCAQLSSPDAVDCGDAPERYLGLADRERVDRVLLVDAVEFGGAGGEVAFCRFEDLVERLGTTHNSGLALLARFLQEEYGKPVAVLGIQPVDTRFGAELSADVRHAVDEVVALLKEAVSQQKPEEMEAAWIRS